MGNAFSSMGGTKLPVGVRHITVVIAVLMSFQRTAAEIEELHDADFHHATGWQEESGTPRADKVDKFEYPETRGSPRLCNTNECAIELSVVASYEKEHDPHDGGLTPLIEGQFGVVMHQSNGMKPKSIQGDQCTISSKSKTIHSNAAGTPSSCGSAHRMELCPTSTFTQRRARCRRGTRKA